MWKIFLAFGAHRFLLIIVAFFAVDYHIENLPKNIKKYSKESPTLSEIQNTFYKNVVHQGERIFLLRSAKSASSNPFFLLHGITVSWFGLDPTTAMVLLSNLFFLLFLWANHKLLTRIVAPNEAVAVGILTVFLPSSFDASLGSQLPVICFLMSMALFGAIDNQWLVSGFCVALLALVNVTALVIFPLLLFIFVFYQRHAMTKYLVQRASFFLVPLIIAIIIDYKAFSGFWSHFSGGALFDFFDKIFGDQPFGDLFSGPYWGCNVMLLFLAVGTVSAALNNTYLVDRIIPIYYFLMFLVYTPYPVITKTAILASICLQGIVQITPRFIFRFILLVFLGGSIYHVISLCR